jgi:hypothetical protein
MAARQPGLWAAALTSGGRVHVRVGWVLVMLVYSGVSFLISTPGWRPLVLERCHISALPTTRAAVALGSGDPAEQPAAGQSAMTDPQLDRQTGRSVLLLEIVHPSICAMVPHNLSWLQAASFQFLACFRGTLGAGVAVLECRLHKAVWLLMGGQRGLPVRLLWVMY